MSTTLYSHFYSPTTSQIVFEALTALILGILGASLNAPHLKDITWQSEMKQQYVSSVLIRFISNAYAWSVRTIDGMDSRMGFGSFVNRGKALALNTKSG